MEELIIRVKIDGMSDTSTTSSSPDRGARGSDGALTGAAIGAALNTGRIGGRRPGGMGELSIGDLGFYKNKDYFTKQGIETLNNLNAKLSATDRLARLGTARLYTSPESAGQPSIYGQTAFGEQLQGFKARAPQIASAAAWKTTAVAVSMTQMRSGDAQYNEQLNNGVKLAGYGAALAFAGPAAPLVAAGIIVNEAVNAFTSAQRYNYNRELEQQQVANIKALAGDISYGRRGGKR